MRPRRYAVLLALLACLLLTAGCLWEDEESNETPFPELSPFPTDLQERIHEIRGRISELRGLPPYEGVKEGAIDQPALEAYYGESFDQLSVSDQEDIESAGVVLKLLGVIDDDVDLEQVFTSEFSGIIAGLYIPEDDSLVLIETGDGEIGIFDEITIAHEYVHSFQDGVYDIIEFSEEFAVSELEEDGYTQYDVTTTCLLEGDATLADQMYAEQVFGPEWRDLVAEETPADAFADIDIPEFLARDFSFSYLECPAFVAALHADGGGWEAVDAAYDDPPATTEQVLHLDKYFDDELANTGPPDDLTAHLTGWRLLDSSQFGEFDVYNWAVTLTGDETASRVAAAGWGSGWVRSYRPPANAARAIVQVSLGWDTENDLIEFLGMYDAMLAAMGVDAEIVSEGNVRWTAEGQAGVLFLDDNLARIEIRVATDAEALEDAIEDLPQFQQEQP